MPQEAATLSSVASASSSGGIGAPNSQLDPGSGFQTPLTAAQTRLIEAQARKTENEADIAYSDAKFQDQFNAQKLEYGRVQIKLGESSLELNDAQKAQLKALTIESGRRTELLGSQIDNVNMDTFNKYYDVLLKDIQSKWEDKIKSAEYQKLLSESGLSKAQAYQIYSMVPYLQKESSARANESNANAANSRSQIPKNYAQSRESDARAATEILKQYGISFQNGILEVDLSNAEDFGKARAVIELINDALAGFVDAISIKRAVFGGKPQPSNPYGGTSTVSRSH